MTTRSRKQIRDAMDKHDARVSKDGQKEAARYLRSKEVPPTQGNIRAGIAFLIFAITIIFIMMAL